jgi:signal peptidase II
MLLWLLLSLILIGFDQLVKAWVVGYFVVEGAPSMVIIDGVLQFTYVRNAGAVFGIGGEAGLFGVFIGAAILAFAVFGYLLAKSDFKNKKLWMYHLAIALLIAGAAGNFIDRLFQPDHNVVDFIDFILFPQIWRYVFNIADMCLVVGIGLFMFDQFLWEPKREKENAK